MSPDEQAQFEPDEQRAIRERVAAGGTPVCPRDGTPMTSRSIGGGSFGLGYARRREWLICPVAGLRLFSGAPAGGASSSTSSADAQLSRGSADQPPLTGDEPGTNPLAFSPEAPCRRLQLSRPCYFRTP